jgi:hypothetical protein
MNKEDMSLPGPVDHSGGVREPAEAKRPKPARGKAWGILNPYGDLWTYETFSTAEAAEAYVRLFWKGVRTAPQDLTRFKPIRVKVTVSALKTPDTTGADLGPGGTTK